MKGYVDIPVILESKHIICSKKDYPEVIKTANCPVKIRKWQRHPRTIPDIREMLNKEINFFSLLSKQQFIK